MSRFAFIAGGLVAAWGLVGAAPVPQGPPAREFVAKLSDPSEKVRAEAAAVLKGRVDALPWLRRAARSADEDTAKRAADLLAPSEKKRQEVVVKAIDAGLRDGCIDLLTEWHHYWQPEKKEDLWSVGPRAAKSGMDLLAKTCRPAAWKRFQDLVADDDAGVDPKNYRFHDGPCPARFEAGDTIWSIRTDRLLGPPNRIRFASAEGASLGSHTGGHFLVLGRVGASRLDYVFLACDGPVRHLANPQDSKKPTFDLGVSAEMSVIVCRGNYTANGLRDSVLLVDGDIDLTGSMPRDCLIRASGEIRLPKGFKPDNCTIEAHAKNATAPYKFFEVADLGLSVADDEEGLVVTGVKAGTPFGDCGLAKGDLIRAIDDAPAGHAEALRKAVRRALVRQGDCLLTITRGDKTHDVPVFFPLPK